MTEAEITKKSLEFFDSRQIKYEYDEASSILDFDSDDMTEEELEDFLTLMDELYMNSD